MPIKHDPKNGQFTGGAGGSANSKASTGALAPTAHNEKNVARAVKHAGANSRIDNTREFDREDFESAYGLNKADAAEVFRRIGAITGSTDEPRDRNPSGDWPPASTPAPAAAASAPAASMPGGDVVQGLPDEKIGSGLQEYILESRHGSWEGYSNSEQKAVESFISKTGLDNIQDKTQLGQTFKAAISDLSGYTPKQQSAIKALVEDFSTAVDNGWIDDKQEPAKDESSFFGIKKTASGYPEGSMAAIKEAKDSMPTYGGRVIGGDAQSMPAGMGNDGQWKF